MKKFALFATAAAMVAVSAPAQAATVTFPVTSPSPGGVITLNPAGPGEVAGFLGFDVSGTGDFLATLTFVNPFTSAMLGGVQFRW